MNKIESEYKTLKRNTVVIAISNIGSKAISFILAPLYSYYLSTDQYGTMDLIITTCGLILPIICLDIYEAVFRYANSDDYPRETVLSTSLSLWGVETIIVIGCLLVSFYVVSIPLFVIVSILYAEIDSYYQIVNQYVRGTNKIKQFAISGIINSILLLVCNIIFVVIINRGLTGWIISFFVAKIACCLYVSIVSNVNDCFSLKNISAEYLRSALFYCIPLLPNSLMWWIMNLSDRYFIVLYAGLSVNGIYAVASKVPSLLSLVENIFFQSWQTSAINLMDNSEKDRYISRVFEDYMIVLSIAVLGVLSILRPIINIFSGEYHSAWVCSGLLVVSVMIHALGGNLGAVFAAQKKTAYDLYTSLAGAITNIVLNIVLVPKWGLVAAAITTLISYLVVLFLRWIYIKKSIRLDITPQKVIVCVLILAIQLIFYYWGNTYNLILMLVTFLGYLVVNRKTIIRILKI